MLRLLGSSSSGIRRIREDVLDSELRAGETMTNKIIFLISAVLWLLFAIVAVVTVSMEFAERSIACVAFGWLAILDDERRITIPSLLARVENLEEELRGQRVVQQGILEDIHERLP
jgi:hypothetical protein